MYYVEMQCTFFFTVPLSHIHSKLQHQDSEDDDDVIVTRNIINMFLGPMWMYAISSVFLFVTYSLNVYKSSGNKGHILSCLVSYIITNT